MIGGAASSTSQRAARAFFEELEKAHIYIDQLHAHVRA